MLAQIPQRHCLETSPIFDKKKQENLEIFTKKWIAEERALSRGTITIPIVVHIVYQSEVENISDKQIHSQIEALNRDFNLENNNLDKIPNEFQNSIANVGFHFCLASFDPDGNPTIGITRTATSEENIFSGQIPWIYYTERGGKDAWDTNNYLNIWVTRTSIVLGFGTRPGINAPTEDGVVISSSSFGMLGNTNPPFDLGRTATHELGHYFNLLHPFGNNCEYTDFVRDTPQQMPTYSGCPDANSSSCGTNDITPNFMNLSEDECLAMFTKGQAMRMQAALIGARKGLLASKGCDQITNSNPMEIIKVYPNPASYYFCVATNSVNPTAIPFRMLDTKGAVILENVVMPDAIQHFPSTQNGIYFLQFFVKEGEPIVKRLLVING